MNLFLYLITIMRQEKGRLRNMKKLLSVIISIALLFTCSAMNVFAEYSAVTGTFTITLNGESGHSYKVYQIFKGDLACEGDNCLLSNIVWGSDVTSGGKTYFVDASTKASSLTDASAAKEFAKQLVEGASGTSYLESGTAMTESPSGTYKVSGLVAGYYLIVDKTTPGTGLESISNYIVQVAKNVTMNPKAIKAPVIEKYVLDATSSSKLTVDDRSIGDTVKFEIDIKLPKDYFDDYSSYKLIIEDTLGSGFHYDDSDSENKAKVIHKNSGGTETDITSYFTADSANPLKLTCNDIKTSGINAVAEDSIIISYGAKLTETATTGNVGNSNKVIVHYSNNPNDSTSLGATAEKEVKVFTYKLEIKKTDQDSTPLKGAEFSLYKEDGITTIKENIPAAQTGTDYIADFSGLDSGTYVLKETKTPSGYNTILPIKFAVASTLNSTTLSLESLSATSTTEAGYTTATFTTVNGLGSKPDYLSTVVVNNKGAILPSTGGIGTTIFYVAGGALVAGAVVLLVLKKKES